MPLTGPSGLTAELLVDNAVPKLPALSPDGRHVGYLVSEMGEGGVRHTDLWLAPLDPADGEPRRLATDLPRTGALRWAPDGAALLCVTGGRIRRFWRHGRVDTLATWDAGLVEQIPLPDGRRLAVLAGEEPSAEQDRREAAGDDAYLWGEHVPCDKLWLFDFVDSTWSPLDALGARHAVAAAVRPDGRSIAVLSWAVALEDPGASTGRLHVVDVDSGKVVDLGAVGVDARSPVWWLDGPAWHIAYIAAPAGSTVGAAIFDVVLPQGEGERTDPPHRDLTGESSACPVALAQVERGAPYAVFAQGLDTAVYRLDPAALEFRRVLERTGYLGALTADADGGRIAVLASTGSEPVDVHAGHAAGPLARLSTTQPKLAGVRWGAQRRLSYQAADGLGLDGLVVLPPRSRGHGPFPLVTLLHGGPYVRYADACSLLAQPCPQWLAAAGYAVFLPNPRGSLGRGAAFARSVVGAVGEEEWTDVLAGVDHLVAQGLADPRRLGLAGWSHGGFLAAWGVCRSDRFKAAVVGAGIADWGMQVGAGELGAQDGELAGSCGWESEGPHPHDRRSPISFASRIRTPVLLLHGEEDPNVPLGQAIYFERALRRYQVEHELVVYPREGHGIWERAHQLDLLRRTTAWFDRWL